MSDAGRPGVDGREWLRLIATPDRGEGDRSTTVTASIAAAHAARRPFQAVIGRPDSRTGQCHWLYGDLFVDHGLSADRYLTPIKAEKVGPIADGVREWIGSGLHLHPTTGQQDQAAGGQQASAPYRHDDVLLAFGSAPVVWVVKAQPVSTSEVADRRVKIAAEIARSEVGGAHERRDADRLQALLELLDARSSVGLWGVTVHVGSSSSGLALAALHALSQVCGLAFAPVRPGEPGGWLGVDEVSSLIAPPAREVPGIRVLARAGWDQVVEVDSGRSDPSLGVLVGENDEPTSQRFAVSTSTLNRHVFVSGATGSGKSETIRTLLEELASQAIPWLVIEPAKAEYDGMSRRMGVGEVLVLRPGDRRYPAGGLNPLMPSSRVEEGRRRLFPLQTHVDLVRALFDAAFAADEPFPQILSAALERSYGALGWDLALDEPLPGARRPPFPTLAELRLHALQVVDETGYGPEIRDNVRGFIQARLGSLEHGTPGRFFLTSHELDLEALASRQVVLQIEDVANERDQAFIIGAVLIRWIEMLRLKGYTSALRHVLVIEEAHRLLRNPDAGQVSGAHAVEMFANLLSEVRAYGQGLVIAEQIPTKVVPDVVKNSALKVVHRLPAADDRAFVGATMNLDEQQSRAIVAFRPGEAAAHSDGMDRPVRLRVRLGNEADASAPPTGEAPMQPRSALCQSACGSAPCPPIALARSARLGVSWELRCWIDLVVLAHLAYRPLPSLHVSHRSWALRSVHQDVERLTCGLVALVERSVKARWSDIAPYHRPLELVRAVVGTSSDYVVSGSWAAGRSSPAWCVRQFRWIDVEEALLADQSDQPHHRTSAWQATYPELELPTAAVAEQLDHVRSRQFLEWSDMRILVFGQPPVLLTPEFDRHPGSALAAIGVDEDWAYQRFAPDA
jgi:uncharacterized protein